MRPEWAAAADPVSLGFSAPAVQTIAGGAATRVTRCAAVRQSVPRDRLRSGRWAARSAPGRARARGAPPTCRSCGTTSHRDPASSRTRPALPEAEQRSGRGSRTIFNCSTCAARIHPDWLLALALPSSRVGRSPGRPWHRREVTGARLVATGLGLQHFHGPRTIVHTSSGRKRSPRGPPL